VIDLKARFGRTYHVTLDPSASQDTSTEERAWHYRIPCRYGFISVHGPETLAAWTGGGRMIARLIAIPGVRVHQRGDREVRVLFGPEALPAVADLLRARRRIQLSPEERQRRAALMAELRKASKAETSGGQTRHPHESADSAG
jgi:hypothetical protein